MADVDPRTAEALRRAARQHIESLRAAGIEFVPAVNEIETPTKPSNAFTTDVDKDRSTTTLFPDTNSLPPAPTPSEAAAKLDPGADSDTRRKELTALAQQVAGCVRCQGLAATRTQTVFGVGKVDPDLCFIGEAPGADEDAQGEPFVGAAGQLLNRIMAACGLKREEVYICNILRCRPPGNRTPLPDEAANCRGFLERQLELVRPRWICALGACAAQNLLNTTLSLGKLRGRFHDYRGIPVWCTYHPAYLLRNPAAKKDVWEDMKQLMAHMGRPIQHQA